MSFSKLTGIVITPNNEDYEDYKKNYNISIDTNPSVIVYCLNEEDIINALSYAKEYCVDFRIRTGRHDFEGNSNIDYGMVIDISEIDFINIDTFDHVVTIGGGCLLKSACEKLAKSGYILPGGTCPNVGISNISTVGGIGLATRYLGLTIDNVLEITLIDSNLNKIIVNDKTNSNLFWALKGTQGSSFGIITSLKFKITPVSMISYFKCSWTEDDFLSVTNLYQQTAYSIDERLTLKLNFEKSQDNLLMLTLTGHFFGPSEEFLPLINPFMSLGTHSTFELSHIPYEQALDKLLEDCYPPNKFKGTGSFIYRLLSIYELQIIIDFIKNAPNGFLHFVEFSALGGNVLNTPEVSSSFAHRSARFLVQIKAIWLLDCDEKINKSWVKAFKKFLDTVGIGTYSGFTDFDISNWQEQYYRNNYNLLKRIKDIYDPENLFKHYQGIEPIKYDFSTLTGTVITKDSPKYNESRKMHIKNFDFYPTVIIYAHNTEDIVNTIKWAKENYINVRLRNGGCCYENFSTGDNSLILDISNLKSFELSLESNTVTVGAGHTVGELYEKLYNYGYQFNGGNCSDIGVCGLVSGGGLGPSSRILGLTCDMLVELKLIDCNGDLIIANNYENNDLFWACRGAGGGNFGVFVELTFEIVPINKITYIKIEWPKEQRFNILNIYQDFMLDADDRLSLNFTMTSENCIMSGLCHATPLEATMLLQPLLCLPYDEPSVTIEYIPFIKAIKNLNHNIPKEKYIKNSNGYVYSPMDESALFTILANIDNTPTNDSNYSITIIPLGGRILKNKDVNSCYAHRDALFLIHYSVEWNTKSSSETNIKWIEDFRKSILPYTCYAYINFPDLKIKDYLRNYYRNSVPILRKIKDKYNPTNMFKFPHSL